LAANEAPDKRSWAAAMLAGGVPQIGVLAPGPLYVPSGTVIGEAACTSAAAKTGAPDERLNAAFIAECIEWT